MGMINEGFKGAVERAKKAPRQLTDGPYDTPPNARNGGMIPDWQPRGEQMIMMPEDGAAGAQMGMVTSPFMAAVKDAMRERTRTGGFGPDGVERVGPTGQTQAEWGEGMPIPRKFGDANRSRHQRMKD